jgi:predicted tellurium resistance membrane protein TerC
MLALVTRLLFLSLASFLASLHQVLFSIADVDFSIRNFIFLLGGLFLIYKASDEIHCEMTPHKALSASKLKSSRIKVIIQIAILDIVFSFDSVITAIGMTPHFEIMAIAICVSVGLMMIASYPITCFIKENPSIKMLAISFILMLGMVLVADGLNTHVPRGYVYFSIIFSLLVETLNILVRKKREAYKKTKADTRPTS